MAYFRFDINDATGDLDANRPVPFRLTPNISEFLTTIGVSGPLTASMIAVARCFAQPNFKVQLLPWHVELYKSPGAVFVDPLVTYFSGAESLEGNALSPPFRWTAS